MNVILNFPLCHVYYQVRCPLAVARASAFFKFSTGCENCMVRKSIRGSTVRTNEKAEMQVALPVSKIYLEDIAPLDYIN